MTDKNARKRLVAFGCSNTQGHNLPGSVLHEDPKQSFPSKFAWPSYLAERMNLECVNLGHGGSSNKLITKRILDTDFLENDCVVVLWTHFVRNHIFSRDRHATRLLPADCDRSIDTAIAMSIKTGTQFDPKNTQLYFQKFYSREDSTWENLVKINFAKQVLDNKGLENYHFFWNPDEDKFRNIDIPDWNRVDLDVLEFDTQLGFADNEGHYSQAAHKKAAEDLFERIQRLRCRAACA